MNKDIGTIESGIVNANESPTNTTKKTKSWFARIMSVLLTDKAVRMRGGGKNARDGYYEIV